MVSLPFLASLPREALARLPIRPGDSTQRRNLSAVNQKRSDGLDIPSSIPSVEDANKISHKQMKVLEKWFDSLPDDTKKRLNQWQKDNGLTRNQLILAALKEWAPQYVGAFKAAMFFGIV
ncbi:hypothetical protein CJF32_00007304 [Rutstroemia sp. NJR-2017a WRK4]|nr:hypothetical protein CJF32_00007304 [Rutstroemia sp. NJR-2017a WRK4]